MAEGGRPKSLALREVAAVLDDFAPGVPAQAFRRVETTQLGVGRVTRHYAPRRRREDQSLNLPLLLSHDKVIPALIAGNTVVLKPSFYTPLTVLRVAELVRTFSPPGILNVVTGGDNVGPWMTSHPRSRQDFVHGAPLRPAGGVRDPRLPDAEAPDPRSWAATDAGTLVAGRRRRCGDRAHFLGDVLGKRSGVGITVKRLLVHESRFDEVAAAALEILHAEQVLGDGSRSRHYDRVPSKTGRNFCGYQATWEGHSARWRRRCLYRGDETEGKGNFFPVTILDNPSPTRRLREARKLRSSEVADPRCGTIDEAIEIANSTDYGLGGSVRGNPATGSWDASPIRMEAGTVWINQLLGRKSERAVSAVTRTRALACSMAAEAA